MTFKEDHRKPYHFDLETSDPDDMLALCILATHPKSQLVSVTIHPGGRDQVGLVKEVLRRLEVFIPVGVGQPKKDAHRVSSFHYDWLGSIPPKEPDGTAVEVIRESLNKYPELHLVTGAALTNIVASLEVGKPFFQEWTGQGGFAGDSVVPFEHRLPKFDGRETCQTFNLGGDHQAALELLKNNNPAIPVRRLVSKNVCHGIFYTPEIQARIPKGVYSGLDLLKEGMQCYFNKHPGGKALHDVIAAVAAIDPRIGIWRPVELYRKQNEWGSRLVDSGPEAVDIMIALNETAFEAVLMGKTLVHVDINYRL
jgi:pyrimidine-specific ribonucleoside hydrolase